MSPDAARYFLLVDGMSEPLGAEYYCHLLLAGGRRVRTFRRRGSRRSDGVLGVSTDHHEEGLFVLRGRQAGAERLQKQDVLFHGSPEDLKGTNTGTSKIRRERERSRE